MQNVARAIDPRTYRTYGYELRSTERHSESIFASRDFRQGEVVMVGHIEAELACNHAYASQVALDRFVFHGGLVSKMNHSCSPNCGIRVNPTGAHNFVARVAIRAGEELTFDYAMRNFVVEFFPEQCDCGSAKCRGTITGWKDLPAPTKRSYRGWAAPYLFRLDAEAALAMPPQRRQSPQRA